MPLLVFLGENPRRTPESLARREALATERYARKPWNKGKVKGKGPEEEPRPPPPTAADMVAECFR